MKSMHACTCMGTCSVLSVANEFKVITTLVGSKAAACQQPLSLCTAYISGIFFHVCMGNKINE